MSRPRGADPLSAPDDPLERSRTGPVFLARQSYRRRRVMDAARTLPFLGTALVLAPVLIPEAGEEGATRAGVIYLFVLWCVLIAAAFWIARRLVGSLEEPRVGSETLSPPTPPPPPSMPPSAARTPVDLSTATPGRD